MSHQKSPSISPFSFKCIASAAGTLGRPGIVIILSQTTTEAINALKESFDFIFIDHEKNRYYSDLLLMENLNLINKGGIVFADNVGIFEDKMKDYFSHVRDSGAYTSKNIGAHLEYVRFCF